VEAIGHQAPETPAELLEFALAASEEKPQQPGPRPRPTTFGPGNRAAKGRRNPAGIRTATLRRHEKSVELVLFRAAVSGSTNGDVRAAIAWLEHFSPMIQRKKPTRKKS